VPPPPATRPARNRADAERRRASEGAFSDVMMPMCVAIADVLASVPSRAFNALAFDVLRRAAGRTDGPP
jgi:hypothetical protein